MSRAPVCALIANFLLLACTSDASEHERASEPSVSALLPACGWTLDVCPAHISWRFETLLDARDVDVDARFVAIGGQALGVTAGSNGLSFVVRVHMESERNRFGEAFRRYTFPGAVSKLIDVVDGIAAAGEPAIVYALACKNADTACSLWRVSADEPDGSPLAEVAGSTFEGEATALLFDEEKQQPCVLAKGLSCFDGAWREEIAASADDNDLRAVAMGSSMSIAVAARGVYWTRPGVPANREPVPWTREDIGADVTWTGASDIYTGYFLIGERGAFMQKLPGANTLCSHTTDFAASSGTVLVTKSGDVLFGLNESRCLLQQLGDEAILGSTTVYCQASQNLLLMTEHQISGTIYCARL